MFENVMSTWFCGSFLTEEVTLLFFFFVKQRILRRAMAYEVRRFPKGLRKFAAPFLAISKHRKKPPSRFFRRRSRNLLLVSDSNFSA